MVNKALSDEDIQRIVGGDAKIIKYSELGHVYDIDQLLTNDKDYCIILYEDAPNRGIGLRFSSTTVFTSTLTPTASSQTRSSSGSVQRETGCSTRTSPTSHS